MTLRKANKAGLITTQNSSLANTPRGGLKKVAGGVMRPSGSGKRALQELDKKAIVAAGSGNIGFVIDATCSRNDNWEEAKSIQARMFRKVSGIGSINLRLVHFGGSNITDRGWVGDPDVITDAMNSVNCEGGETQILESIERIIAPTETQKADNIILVGDAFEEDTSLVVPLAKRLKKQSIKVFSFLEGSNPIAEEAFKALSEHTGGRFAQFGAGMPLNELCEGVALLSIGGQSALARLENANVRRLFLTGPKA